MRDCGKHTARIYQLIWANWRICLPLLIGVSGRSIIGCLGKMMPTDYPLVWGSESDCPSSICSENWSPACMPHPPTPTHHPPRSSSLCALTGSHVVQNMAGQPAGWGPVLPIQRPPGRPAGDQGAGEGRGQDAAGESPREIPQGGKVGVTHTPSLLSHRRFMTYIYFFRWMSDFFFVFCNRLF